MENKEVKYLLTVAQEGNLNKFIQSINQFFKNHDSGQFGQISHRKSGDAILHVLARNGHAECFRFLIKQFSGKEFVDLEIRNLDGKTPLHEATQHGQQQLVDLLLQAGAKVNQLKRADWSPAMLAVTHPGRLAVLKSLLQAGVDVNIMNKDGWGVFHIATRTGDLDVLIYLLKLHPKAWDTVSKNGRTPLHTAALSGSKETVELLLKAGAHINRCDGCGSTPLMDAVRADSVETVDLMLSWKELDKETVDKVGRNPVHVGAEAGSIQALQSLTKAGFSLESLTSSGQTALHSAAREGQLDTVRWLLSAGLELNVLDENGRSPLFLAVSGQHVQTTKLLLEAGAERNSDNSGIPLLDLARREELKQLLL